MKKFFAALIVAATLLICQNPAQAVDVRLCDYTVESVLNFLKRAGDELGIDVWGTEYYTYKGARRCEVHFGNSRNNTIRLRLNNDNTIARALVTIQASSLRAAVESGFHAGAMATAILVSTGMNQSEAKILFNDAMDKFLNAIERNPYMTHYHEKSSVWCSSIQRCVVWDYEVSNSSLDIYLYAYN